MHGTEAKSALSFFTKNENKKGKKISFFVSFFTGTFYPFQQRLFDIFGTKKAS